jgi:hypothetical protein
VELPGEWHLYSLSRFPVGKVRYAAISSMGMCVLSAVLGAAQVASVEIRPLDEKGGETLPILSCV